MADPKSSSTVRSPPMSSAKPKASALKPPPPPPGKPPSTIASKGVKSGWSDKEKPKPPPKATPKPTQPPLGIKPPGIQPPGIQSPPPPPPPPPPPSPPSDDEKEDEEAVEFTEHPTEPQVQDEQNSAAPPPPPPPPPPASSPSILSELEPLKMAWGGQDAGMPPPPPPPPPPQVEMADEVKEDTTMPEGPVRKGKLDILIYKASGLHPKAGKKADPYLQMELQLGRVEQEKKGRLGRKSAKVNEVILRKRAKTLKDAGGEPDWQGELISFDLEDLSAILHPDNTLPPILKLSVWDDNVFSDEKIAEGQYNIARLLSEWEWGKQIESHEITVPLHHPPSDGPIPPPGEIQIKITYEPCNDGVLVVTCLRGRNLKKMDLIGRNDPYLKFTWGKITKRSRTHQRGGSDPDFEEEQMQFWIEGSVWKQELLIQCFDEDMASDDLIGTFTTNINRWTTITETVQDWFSLMHKGKVRGEIELRFEFFPAGNLSITIAEGRNLVDRDTMGRMDPYCILTLEGFMHTFKHKTKVDTNGSTQPLWNEVVQFGVVDHYLLRLVVMDSDTFSSDDFVGELEVSLTKLYKFGMADEWLKLRNRDRWGRELDAGEIHLIMDFEGPPGVAYPQLRSSVESFDDSKRVSRSEREARLRKQEEEMEARERAKNKQDEPEDKQDGSRADADVKSQPKKSKSEFTDEEIQAAFRFLDLDGNQFIGAGEIRHILICMGELITDEEVDEMIRMLDNDGDGQISFDEFYHLCTATDLSKETKSEEKQEKSSEDHTKSQSKSNQKEKVDPDAAKSRDALRLRQDKQESLARFVLDNSITTFGLKQIVKTIRDANPEGEVMLVDEDRFMDLFDLEPTREYRRLFGLFETKHSPGKVDMREFLLGLYNFATQDKSDKIKFAFVLFDDDGNGTLSIDELIQILKANHLAADESQIKRKAEMIMRQSDKDGSGSIDQEEFEAISKKFPNVLFPTYEAPTG